MSRTFHALSDTGKILAKLEEVAGELSADLTDGGWTGKTITLKYKLDTFQGTPPWSGTGFGIREYSRVVVCTRAKSLDKWLSTKKEDLFAVRSSCFFIAPTPRSWLTIDDVRS